MRDNHVLVAVPPEAAEADLIPLLLATAGSADATAWLAEPTRASVVVIAPWATTADRTAWLHAGASVVLHGDVTDDEILAQVAALLRDRTPAGDDVKPGVVDGAVVVTDLLRELRLAGRNIRLTDVEHRLLVVLAGAPGRVFSRTELMELVWGSSIGAASLVSAQVRRLRQKIEHDPKHPERILTSRGAGYRYRDA